MANLIWDSAGQVWKGTFTIANDGTGNSNETFTIDLGDMESPVTVTLDGIDTVLYPGATNSINVVDCSTWNLTATPPTVTEGDTVTLSLATAGVSNRSVPFSITGLQNGDLDTTTGVVSWNGTKYVGSFNLVNNASSPNLTLNILNDNISDDGEVMTISLDNGNDSATVTINDIVQTWNLTATPTTVTEGNSVTVTLNTTNVPNGLIPFSISGTGIDSGDIAHGAGEDVTWDNANSKFDGNFNLSGNTASITLNTIDDGVGTGGSETFTLSLDNGESSVNVTIDDAPVTASCGDTVPDWNDGTSKSIITSGDPQVIVPLGNYNTTGFENGGTLYLPQLSNSPANDSMFVSIPIDPNSPTLGLITWTLSPSVGNSTFFYEDLNGDCWQGDLLGTSPSTLTKL